MKQLRTVWQFIRRLSGDDAYERYLRAHNAHHPECTPLSRTEFFKAWQDGKWQGIKRCC